MSLRILSGSCQRYSPFRRLREASLFVALGWEHYARGELRLWADFRIGFVFFGGLAGGIFVFLKGSIFPETLAVPVSVEPLVMVLLGGVHSLAGAPLGAALYKILDTVVTRYTEYWQLALGLILVVLVLVFPRGILGVFQARDRG